MEITLLRSWCPTHHLTAEAMVVLFAVCIFYVCCLRLKLDACWLLFPRAYFKPYLSFKRTTVLLVYKLIIEISHSLKEKSTNVNRCKC